MMPEPVRGGQVRRAFVSGNGWGMIHFETYDSALAFLHSHVDLERTRRIPSGLKAFRLDRMRSILDALDRPHEAFPTIHVAGTKGKGSTVAMTAAALRGCGLTVGTYTSPHLIDVRERIAINDVPIDKETMRWSLEAVAQAAQRCEIEKLHFFELLTAAGFLVFAHQAVDVAVIEVGLGGRLDATNVITPEVCAMTAVSLDHMDILGSTIAEIAGEKAGIFKPHVPAVSVVQLPECEAVFREIADQASTPLAFLEREIEFSARSESTPSGPVTRVSFLTSRSDFDHVQVPLLGEQQGGNCGLALGVIDALRGRGWTLPDSDVIEGLASTVLHGRMEMVSADPRILIDGAHNPASMTSLMKTLCATQQFESLIAIFGCSGDKDIDAMLTAVAGAADKVIFSRAKGNARAADPEHLCERFAALTGRSALWSSDVDAAIETASSIVDRQDLIVVTGSFYLVGQARAMFVESQPNPPADPAMPIPEIHLRPGASVRR